MIERRRPFADRLLAGLAEAMEYAEGRLTLRTIDIPAPPPKVTAKDVVALRNEIAMSQAVFARLINVSPKTVQSWEQGEREPSHAALRVLQLLRAQPDVICRTAGIPFPVHADKAARASSTSGRRRATKPKSRRRKSERELAPSRRS